MSPFLSPGSHTRHSHYLHVEPPLNAPPPSSFSRSSSAVKSSLRKIPSSLFTRPEDKVTRKDKLAIYEEEPQRSEGKKKHSPVIQHPRPLFSSPKRATIGGGDKEKKETGRVKGKTRKALAEILHWGNSSHPAPSKKEDVKPVQPIASQFQSHPSPAPRSAARPTTKDRIHRKPVPATLSASTHAAAASMIQPPAILRKRSSRHLTSQPSRSGLPNLAASLRGKSLAPVRNDVKSRSRPSMAPDPFESQPEGAEVIDRVQSRVGSLSSVSTSAVLDRRNSVASKKALSVKTVLSDTGSAKTLPERPRVMTPASLNLPIETLVETDRTPQQQKHTSAPLPSKATLSDLPPRSASLGRVLASADQPFTSSESARISSEQDFRLGSAFERPGSRAESYKTSTSRQVEVKPRLGYSPATTVSSLPPVPPVPAVAPEKALKKEKTMSRVWSLFKGKKDKGVPDDSQSNAPVRRFHEDEPFVIPPRRVESLRQAQQPIVKPAPTQITASKVAIAPRAAPTRYAVRPRPPVLHLTKPSLEGKLHRQASKKSLPSPPFTNLVPKTASTQIITPVTGPNVPPLTAFSEHLHSDDECLTGKRLGNDGKLWETVAGSMSQKSTVYGGSGTGRGIVTTGTRKVVPKRKSLTGLFGLAMKKSFDRIKPGSSPPSVFASSQMTGTGRMRSLAEEMEDAEGVSDVEIGRKQSNFSLCALEMAQMRQRDASYLQPDGEFPVSTQSVRADQANVADLSQVASATVRLYDLVEQNDFSPAPTDTPRVSPSPSQSSSLELPSFTTFEADGSPTPMRRIRSAVLTSKKSKDSPLRVGGNISPLKLALHRSQMAGASSGAGKSQSMKIKKPRPVSSPAASPPKSSMVKKGMRNIFAPPSPPLPPIPTESNMQPPQPRLKGRAREIIPELVVDDKTERRGSRRMDKRISGINQLGLPLPPPEDRVSPRRNAQGPTAPPAMSLPPVPDAFAQHDDVPMQTDAPLRMDMPTISEAATVRPTSDYLSPAITMDEYRASFDFTGEYAKLDQGTQRNSFVEALARVRSIKDLSACEDLPPVPALPQKLESLPEDHSLQLDREPLDEATQECTSKVPETGVTDVPVEIGEDDVESSDAESSDAESEESIEVGEPDFGVGLPPVAYSRHSHSPHSSRESKSSKASTVTVHRRSPRPPPFQGNPAFRMRVSQLKDSMTPPASTNPKHATGLLEKSPSLAALVAAADAARDQSPEAQPDGISEPAPAHGRMNSLEPPRAGFMDFGHERAESGMSIATMSSLGAVIETGIAGEYTNYFEVNFTKHLQAQSQSQSLNGHAHSQSQEIPPLPINAHTHSRVSSSSGIPLPISRASRDSLRAAGRRRHHRRNSSIASIDSIPGVEIPEPPNGPPVSMYNPRRASHVSYVSRHRRGTSGEGSFGRPDWAAHRRITSTDSNRSCVSSSSISRLGRPGLGEKMFELDGGIQLTSITASPLDDANDRDDEVNYPLPQDADGKQDAARAHGRGASIDSPNDSRATWDSLLDASFRPVQPGSRYPEMDRLRTNDDDSIFGDTSKIVRTRAPIPHAAQAPADSPRMEARPDSGSRATGFFLQPLRPVSMVSSANSTTEEEEGDDCINVAKYAKRLALPAQEQCFEGEGEDDTLTKAQLSMSTASNGSGRRALGMSATFSRPAKPRRRPAELVFKDFNQPDTPALSSPSASETSSRLSLETKFSDGASFFSASRLRPKGAGHDRQKSSQGVKVHATIKEEPSLATLRAFGSPYAAAGSGKGKAVARPQVEVKSWYADGEEEDEEVLQQLKKWSELRDEAEYECRRGRMLWEDPRSTSFLESSEFEPPKTVRDIMDFLAQSQATYRPLDERPATGPTGHPGKAHRRKSSLSDSRSLTSPYGLPLPVPTSQRPQRPKGSLQTKFERTNSAAPATSSHFSFCTQDTDGRTPKSSTSSTASPFAGLFPELAGPLPVDPPAPPPVTKPQVLRAGSTGPSIFAQFARQSPPSPPPTLPSHTPFSPFQLPPFDFCLNNTAGSSSNPRGQEQGEKAVDADEKWSRVTSSARRKALGWGRRRNSDGPTKVEVLARRADDDALTEGTRPISNRVKALKMEPQFVDVNTQDKVPAVPSLAATLISKPGGDSNRSQKVSGQDSKQHNAGGGAPGAEKKRSFGRRTLGQGQRGTGIGTGRENEQSKPMRLAGVPMVTSQIRPKSSRKTAKRAQSQPLGIRI